MDTLHVRVEPDTEGGWEIALVRGEEPPVRGRLEPARVAAVLDAVTALPDAEVDADTWERAELRAGRALGSVLEWSGPPTRTWMRALGRAEERGEPLVIVLEAVGDVAALPWELMSATSTAPLLEPCGAGTVVRRVPGMPPFRPCADQARRCVVERAGAFQRRDAVGHALAVACEERGLPPPLPRNAPVPRIAALVAESPERLHDGTLPLAERLAGADLAWIAVTGGPLRPSPDALGFAEDVLAQGCGAVVHSSHRLEPGAATLFGTGLWNALLGGETPLAAVVAGRALLRELGGNGADGRWWQQRLVVGDVAALVHTPFPRLVRPSGWPEPDEEAAAVLHRARAAGEVDGYLGVEHLAEATLDAAPRSVASLLPALRGFLVDARRRMLLLEPQRRDDPRVSPTPRLQRVIRRLPAGFGVRELWEALAADGWDLSAEGREAADDARRAQAGVPARALEVLGGPEDGRRIVLGEGEVVGRASSDRRADVGLYDGTAWTDLRLSRRHLRWLDEGWVHLLVAARAVRRRDRSMEAVEGPVELAAGDVVELTAATWLLAVGDTGEGG